MIEAITLGAMRLQINDVFGVLGAVEDVSHDFSSSSEMLAVPFANINAAILRADEVLVSMGRVVLNWVWCARSPACR